MNCDDLDPGIRDTVKYLNDHGFITTDSGDGVSKPKDWYGSGEAIPFPHVVVRTTLNTMREDADRLADALGPRWSVEAVYQPASHSVHLFAQSGLTTEADIQRTSELAEKYGWEKA